MKTATRMLAALLLATCFHSALAAVAAAQQDGQTGLVAVIDVAKVFAAHKGHAAKMDAIKAEIEAFEKEFREKRQSFAAQVQTLQGLVGQPNYKEEEANLARKEADMTIEANQRRQDIVNREAQIYFETYQHVSQTVARLCQTYNISLVINYDSSEIDPNSRESVIKGVNRNVVFQRDLDLTGMAIEMVNAPGN